MITLIPALILLVSSTTAERDFLKYLNTSVDPCDDFYQYSCGNFAKYHQRPEYQDVLDLFTLTEDQLVQVGHEILSSPIHAKDDNALKKVKAAYKACIDVEYSDYLSVPELNLIQEFGGMPLINTSQGGLDWIKIANLIATTGVSQIFDLMVENFDPDTYTFILYPDSEEEVHMIRPKYGKSYDEVLEQMLKKTPNKVMVKSSLEMDAFDLLLMNISRNIVDHSSVFDKTDAELAKNIQDARDFLTQLINGGIVDDDVLPLDQYPTIKQLQNWTDTQFGDDLNLNWLEYVGEIFRWAGISITEDSQILTLGPEAVYGPLNLIRKTDPNIVKNAFLLRSFVYLAPDSDAPTRKAFENFLHATGLQVYDRWEYCTRKILDVVDPVGLGFAVTHVYQRYHYDVNKISKATGMIGKLREAFREELRTLDWVDDASLGHLLKKVDNMVVDLAYPNFVSYQEQVDIFYENVRICEWDNYGNARRIRAFRKAHSLAKYNERDNFWKYSPLEANAYAIQQNNKIVIPVAIIQEGFFPGDDVIVDYARLGTTIAHEMTHNFDSQGITFNENAYQNEEFLTNATETEITTRMQCLVDQYSGYYVEEIDAYVNGKRTLDENFADNGGIRKAFMAFQNETKGQKNKVMSEGYTPEQLFFIAYGTMWCSLEKVSWLNNLVLHNTHAPSRIRMLGTLSNFEKFSETFQCPLGTNMNPQNKCMVW